MKLWRGLLVFYYSVAIQGLGAQSGESRTDALQCYTCHSHNSFEDCFTRVKLDNCSEGESCLKIKIIREPKENGVNKTTTSYAKYCTNDCSDRQCKQLGWYCEMDCCNENLCNNSAVIKVDAAVVAAFFWLVLQNIFAF